MSASESAKGSYCQDFQSFEIDSFARKNDMTVSRYSNQLQFWLSCLGYAVGYGNIWRFPYMLYKNGGGVFLIPYFICIMIIVLPLSYLEISYGQIYRRAIHRYYDVIHPRLLGLSFGISAIIFSIAVYYMCLIAWCFTFILYSFQDPLPWAPKEGTDVHEALTSDSYFIDTFLGRSDSLFDITSYQPVIMFSFLVVNLINFLTIYEGIDTAKYAVYIMVPLPYILMAILFVKGLTLPGYYEGWAYLFKPDWSKLYTLSIWSDAAGQVLFSAGLAQNTIVKFASHRNEKDPLFWSTVLIPFLNFATSLFAALALFSFIGYASYETGVPINDMPIHGMELTFVVYPALLNLMPFPQFWSVLFFVMLTFLGLGTNYIFIECVSNLIHGTCSRRKGGFKRSPKFVTFIICALIFTLNILLFASSSGYYWLETADHYASSINLVVFMFFQLIVIVYFLPISELVEKVNKFGEKFPSVYIFPLKVVVPAFSLFLAIVAVVAEIKNPMHNDLFADTVMSYILFATPMAVFILIFWWNPFGRYDIENKGKDRASNLLNDSDGEYGDYDDYS